MTPQELTKKLKTVAKEIQHDCANIIAETSVEYFKDSFKRKAFNGRSWKRTVKRTGSTLIESGNLMNSIRPTEVTDKKVVIAAGNEKVAYARVHNEGGVQYVKPHHRAGRKDKRHQVKGYSYKATKRQFMGESQELNEAINKRITEHLKQQFNQ